MPSKKMLVAVRPQDLPLVTQALGTEFNLVICHSLKEAKAALDDTIGLIACGARFDEGRMLDLLRHAKESPQTQPIPFFCISGAGKSFPPATLEAIKQATQVLRVNGFVDLVELRTKFGDEQAYERLRESIRNILAK